MSQLSGCRMPRHTYFLTALQDVAAARVQGHLHLGSVKKPGVQLVPLHELSPLKYFRSVEPGVDAAQEVMSLLS